MNRIVRTAASLCAAASLLVGAQAARADEFPSKPIRVVVPYPAGDLADVIARLISTKTTETLGQPMVVENRPGASGLIGLNVVAQADPDGYTLVMGQMGSMAVAPITNKWSLDVRKAFQPVAMAYTNYMMFVTTKDFPAKTLPDLIAYAKAHPGKIRVATNGEGGFPHLSVELLKEKTGFDFTHIPYKGSSQIVSDVVEGRVEMTVFGFSGLYPFVQDGRLNGVAVTGRNRAPTAQNIPTVGETVPGYEALGWFGLFAPQGTPAAAIAKINKAVNEAMKDPDIMAQARRLGLDSQPGSPEDFGKAWSADYDKWGGIIRGLGLEGSK